tara:strand:+ start:38414 stop:40696 length:2283 start_codon:yes stop_codon:yes gene_type:complete
MPFSLLHPALFAFGVACVSIPIILHLLKRKRRPIPWGAMRFLEQAYRKRRRILTIEQLILLAIRCLVLLLLALGVGSLMLGSGSAQSLPTTMVIVIDNSIASALVDPSTNIRAIDTNKQIALDALDTLDPMRGDQAMLIAGSTPANGIVMPESADLDSVRSLIESLEPSDARFDLAGAMSLTQSLAQNLSDDPERPTHTILTIARLDRGEPNEQNRAGESEQSKSRFDRVRTPTPPTNSIENIGIATAEPTRSLVTNKGVHLPLGIRVELIRSGDVSTERTTTITILDQQQRTIGEQRNQWNAGQRALEAVVAIDPSSIKPLAARTAIVRANIDDDANPRDNTHLIPLATRTQIRVGVIDRSPRARNTDDGRVGSAISPSRWVRSALAPSEAFGISITSIEASQAASMLAPNLDAICILAPAALDQSAWDRIAQLNTQGVLLIVTPDAQASSLSWLDQLNTIAPGLIATGSVLREHEQPIGLAIEQPIEQSSGTERNGAHLLAGIGLEIDELARSTAITRSIRFAEGLELSESSVQHASPLMLLDDGSPLAIASTQGIVVFSTAFDLEWTNLPARPLFVPMMQELVRQGVGQGSRAPLITAGDRIPAEPWVASSQRIAIDPTSTQVNADSRSHAGVIAQRDTQGVTKALAVLNPDASGALSDVLLKEAARAHLLQFAEPDFADGIDWIDWAASDSAEANQTDASKPEQTSTTSPTNRGVSLALWMLMAAAILAIVETLLARLFTAKLAQPAPGLMGARYE